MIKIAIIDDDNASIEALVQMLKAFDDTTIVGKANNGTKGISLVRQEQPDMLFLDVEMPDMTGL
jgi:two-component system LytT family response regulator